MIFYTVRHGSTHLNKERRMQGRINSSISRDGKLEVIESSRLVGEDLLANREKDVRIYSSTLKRCVETTDIIAKSLSRIKIKSFISFHEELVEMSFGEWEGKKKEEIDKEILEERSRNIWSFRIPSGESYQDVYDRVKSFVIENRIKESKTPVIFVGHEKTCQCLDGILNRMQKKDILRNRYSNGEFKKYVIS